MLTEEEFDAFWEEADVNHDGKLDYEEFIKIMSQYWNRKNIAQILKMNNFLWYKDHLF